MRRIRRKRGPVRAKKVSYDGIQFQSGLEKYCYIRLKEAGLFEKYEEESFQLLEPTTIENRVYERQSNGKGEFKLRSSNIRGIKYTPDFTGRDFIIETKGRANESFPIRFKLFKVKLKELGDSRAVYKPQNQKEIDKMIEIIKSLRN